MDTFDYVIVGGGAAGSVLADRLTADGQATVCVLEAGPADRNPLIRMPAGFAKLLNNPAVMWQFYSEPAEGTDGRRVYLPQGRVLGGSSAINGLVYNRGQARDFNDWAALGATGWAHDDVLPYFKRSETRLGGDPEVRGTSGPLHISDSRWRDPICDAFIAAVGAHGIPVDNDYNGRSQRGTGYYQRFIRDERRVSAAHAFLHPAMRRVNLTVRTGCLVTRILVKDQRASGVEFVPYDVSKGQAPTAVHARREVVLSAGTVNTTRLLQGSGIGPAPLLQSLGIPVVHALAGVGANFQDHYFVRLAARLQAGTISLNQRVRGWRLVAELARWAMRKPGVLGLSPSVAYAFLNSHDMTGEPDLQFVFAPGSYRPGRVYELDTFPAATCGFTQQRPESVGHVRIRSADPREAPDIQPNYLHALADQQAVVRGMRLARKFLRHAPMSELFDREEVPGDTVQTDEQMLAYARRTGNTGYHLVGTCTMGAATNPMAVVGPDLRVHGMQGLRVIDASVMPRVTSSNTCAATLMIAEKGADLMLGKTMATPVEPRLADEHDTVSA